MSVTLHTKTGLVKIELQLINDSQCKHIENFLRHCAKGTYDSNTILRYIPSFILQTGDPSNSGKESSPADTAHVLTNQVSKEFERYKSEGEIKRGTVFMVNNPNNEDGIGSQFFITLSDEHKSILGDESKYTIIGHIIDGFESIEKLENDEELNNKEKLKKSGKPRGRWKSEIWLESTEIHNNPFSI